MQICRLDILLEQFAASLNVERCIFVVSQLNDLAHLWLINTEKAMLSCNQ